MGIWCAVIIISCLKNNPKGMKKKIFKNNPVNKQENDQFVAYLQFLLASSILRIYTIFT